MSEEKNLEITQGTEEQSQDKKTFTQEQVNEIVKKRLAREKSKGPESI